jgi:3-deoxy-7-phosphoheptulonate synthase
MIIPKDKKLTPSQLEQVTEIVQEFNCVIQEIVGAHMNVYAILGDEGHELMFNRLEGLDYVMKVDRIESPFKLMDVRSELQSHVIYIGGVELKKRPLFIAGHCTVDPKNPSMYLETAHALKEVGINALRGGVWKPRTMPYSYQGEDKAMEIMLEARSLTGLPINVEVMDERQLKLAVEARVDILQIGTRNALNYSLLKEVGILTRGTGICVLLKRGRHIAPVDEFIAASEYIAAGGNLNVMLCPRGTTPSLEGYRNHPDESITPLLKEKTWAPVIVDPSHSVGKAKYVASCTLASFAYGADGVCIESHIDPKKGIGDDPKQSITPSELKELINNSKALWDVVHKH